MSLTFEYENPDGPEYLSLTPRGKVVELYAKNDTDGYTSVEFDIPIEHAIEMFRQIVELWDDRFLDVENG